MVYDYLVTGEVTKIRENGATSGARVLAVFGYDDLGRRVSLTRSNGVVTSYGYDAVSRLSSLGLDLASTVNDLVLGFTYNRASQVTGVTRSNDLYAFTGRSNLTVADTVDGLNRLTMSGTTALGYDARGNVTGIGAAVYGYSSENLLTSAPGGVTLAYDPLLRLAATVGTTTTRFLYDGDAMIGEYDAGGTLLYRYVHGPGVDEPLVRYDGAGTVRRWLIADERGSVVAVTSATGAPISGGGINRYDEYGVPASSNVGRFGYTGQTWLPELGMWYYKARVYAPNLGRFMQTDPVGYDAGMNLYAYVGGDPVNRSDQSGLCGDPMLENGYLPCGEIIVTGPRYTPVDLSGYFTVPAPIYATELGVSGGVGEIIPPPPPSLPGGPYTAKPPTPGNKPGSFLGPKQPKGPRPQAQWVPPEAEGGPPGSKGYWKIQLPGEQGWNRYNQNGQPLTPDEAHPNPGSTRSFFFLGPIGAFLCALFCESPAY